MPERRDAPVAANNHNEGGTMDDDQIKANLAAVRERMVAALGADEEAVKVLNSVFPNDWSDAELAVIWMLGNAARFADPDTNGICTPAFAQGWLDRLVDPEGNPRDELGRSVIERVMDENALSANGSLTKVFDRADRLVLEMSVLKTIPERAASRDEVRAKFVEHLTDYAYTLVDALYEPKEAAAVPERHNPGGSAANLRDGAPVSPADTPDFRMLCAICSEPLNGAILTEDCKWVHPECEENAEWNEEPL